MSVDAPVFRRVVAAFLASRTSQSTREAYRRDLTHLAAALGVGGDGIPGDDEIRDAFGIEDDPEVRDLLDGLVGLGPGELVIVAQRAVRGGQQRADRGLIAGFQQVDGLQGAAFVGQDVPGQALEGRLGQPG